MNSRSPDINVSLPLMGQAARLHREHSLIVIGAQVPVASPMAAGQGQGVDLSLTKFRTLADVVRQGGFDAGVRADRIFPTVPPQDPPPPDPLGTRGFAGYLSGQESHVIRQFSCTGGGRLEFQVLAAVLRLNIADVLAVSIAEDLGVPAIHLTPTEPTDCAAAHATLGSKGRLQLSKEASSLLKSRLCCRPEPSHLLAIAPTIDGGVLVMASEDLVRYLTTQHTHGVAA
jgi:hypothetical protein